MRASASSELIKLEDGTVVGIMLEHNYCSEHEWGVDELRRLAGGIGKDDHEGHESVRRDA